MRQDPIRADGIFGPETDAAVRLFQRAQGLAVDGVAGAQTLARLDQLLKAGRDPLALALNDLGKLGTAVVQQNIPGGIAGMAFSRRLADASGLIFGNPQRFLVLLKRPLPYA